MFAKYDLKYLEDPENGMGSEEQIHTMVRKGLKEDQPEAYKVLDNFHWSEKIWKKLCWKSMEKIHSKQQKTGSKRTKN